MLYNAIFSLISQLRPIIEQQNQGKDIVVVPVDSKEPKSPQGDVDYLKLDVEKLLMITEAMWKMMKEKHGYTDEDLAEAVLEIDMQDGRLDGKVAAKTNPIPCPNCNRPVSRRRPQCYYCGEVIKKNLFDR